MPPGVQLLDAFVRIFADQSELRKAYKGLEGEARDQGRKAGEAFQSAFAAVTPKRAAGAGPPLQTLEGTRVGGLVAPEGASPFSRAGVALARARSAAAAQADGVKDLDRSLGRLAGGGAKQAELAALRLSAGFRLVSPEASTIGTQLITLARGFGVMGAAGLAAGGVVAGVGLAMLPFITRASAAVDSTLKLAQAQSKADFGAFKSIIEADADALTTLGVQAEFALQPIDGLQGFFQKLIGVAGVAKNALAEFFGGGAARAAKDAEAARVAASALFQVLEKPKIDAEGLKESAELLMRQAEASRDGATSAGDLARVTDMLLEANRRRAQADRQLVDAEIARLELERVRGGLSVEVDAKLAAARQRRVNVEQQASLEEERIRKDAARSAAALAEAELKHGEAVTAQYRRRRDVIIAAVGQIVEAEAAANLSLEEAFRARTRLQDEQTANLLQNLKEEAAARRAALEARLEGATGQDRVAIERELTQVTEDETSKRTEIESQAAAQRVQLLQRERQERLAQAEQLFSIQRTLGQRRLQDEVLTQSGIAAAARTGSNAQLAALQKVAELQAQVQGQARSLAQQAVGIVQAQAQRLGLEGPAFVSRASLERDLARQRKRDEEVRARFAAGGAVRTEEFQAPLGQQQFFEQFRQFGTDFGQVFRDATTPIREAFESAVGPALTEQLENLTQRAQASVTSLVDGLGSAFGKVPEVVGAAFDAAIARVESGTSQIVGSITRMVEEQLTRNLADAARRI